MFSYEVDQLAVAGSPILRGFHGDFEPVYTSGNDHHINELGFEIELNHTIRAPALRKAARDLVSGEETWGGPATGTESRISIGTTFSRYHEEMQAGVYRNWTAVIGNFQADACVIGD